MSDQILSFRQFVAANPTQAERTGAAAVLQALDKIEKALDLAHAELTARGQRIRDLEGALVHADDMRKLALELHQAEITMLRAEIDRLGTPAAYSDAARRARGEGIPVSVAPTIGITQGAPPPGPRRGTRVAVSIYLPHGTPTDRAVQALEALGYSEPEVRLAASPATQTRLSAGLEAEVILTERRARADLAKKLGKGTRIDVQVWPAF